MEDINRLVDDANSRFWRCSENATRGGDNATAIALMAVAHAIRWSTLVQLRASAVPAVPGTDEQIEA